MCSLLVLLRWENSSGIGRRRSTKGAEIIADPSIPAIAPLTVIFPHNLCDRLLGAKPECAVREFGVGEGLRCAEWKHIGTHWIDG